MTKKTRKAIVHKAVVPQEPVKVEKNADMQLLRKHGWSVDMIAKQYNLTRDVAKLMSDPDE